MAMEGMGNVGKAAIQGVGNAADGVKNYMKDKSLAGVALKGVAKAANKAFGNVGKSDSVAQGAANGPAPTEESKKMGEGAQKMPEGKPKVIKKLVLLFKGDKTAGVKSFVPNDSPLSGDYANVKFGRRVRDFENLAGKMQHKLNDGERFTTKDLSALTYAREALVGYKSVDSRVALDGFTNENIHSLKNMQEDGGAIDRLIGKIDGLIEEAQGQVDFDRKQADIEESADRNMQFEPRDSIGSSTSPTSTVVDGDREVTTSSLEDYAAMFDEEYEKGSVIMQDTGVMNAGNHVIKQMFSDEIDRLLFKAVESELPQVPAGTLMPSDMHVSSTIDGAENLGSLGRVTPKESDTTKLSYEEEQLAEMNKSMAKLAKDLEGLENVIEDQP